MRDHAKELQDAADFIDAHPGGYDISTSLLREAAAKIERLRAASQWRTTSELPKLDEEVLLWDASECPQIIVGMLTDDGDGMSWQFADGALADIQPEGMEPTHWMPLPSPPTQEGGK